MSNPSPCTRRWGLLIGLLCLGLLSPARAEKPTRPLNIVILLVDDLGWADTGAYGADLHQTPNIGRLAREGVRFTDAYAASPVCSPTRASILTGQYPARLKMTIWREAAAHPPRDRKLIPPVVRSNLPLAEVTIAERLHQAGYLTVHIGKWHLGSAGYYPEAQGFDIDIGGTLWGAPQTYFFPYRGDRHYGGEFRYVPGLFWGHRGKYLPDHLTDKALEVIDRAAGRPFFLNMCYYSVHTPVEGKPALVQRFRALLRPGMHHTNPGYAAMVHSVDADIGRLLRKIDEKGLRRNTVVILASDNGGFVNRYEGARVTNNYPLRSGKGSLYEGGVRVPLIVRWPGVTPAGAVCHEPVSTIDFYPTMLAMAGLGRPRHPVDGLSLVPVLRNPHARLGRAALYFHYPHYYPTTTPVSSIRCGDWKLLEYFEDHHLELYNLARDLSERHDVARHYPAKVRRLRYQLHAWWRAVGAPLPRPNPHYPRR